MCIFLGTGAISTSSDRVPRGQGEGMTGFVRLTPRGFDVVLACTTTADGRSTLTEIGSRQLRFGVRNNGVGGSQRLPT
jgi:hypothetical protein